MDTHATDQAPKATILIVEDSPTQAEQLRFLLEDQNFKVALAYNGRDALKMLKQNRPTIVITDIVMPEMDGYQLCTAIKSDPELKTIPVVVVTALTGMQDIAKSLECGADNFLRKPYDPEILLSRVNYILLNQEMRKGRKVQMGMEVMLEGKKHFITSDREQIVDMLISTYEEAMHMYDELQMQQKEIAHSNQTLRGLFHIAESLNQVSSESEVCERTLQGIMELPAFRAGWIYLQNGNSFRTAASWHLPAALNGHLEEGPCRCLQILQSGQIPPSVGIIECERLRPVGAGVGHYSHAMIPLLGGTRCLGVMNIIASEGVVFGDEDMKILKAVGSQVVVALERAELHASLALRATQLEAANKELESFSYSVSHDLRAPLRAIDGFSRMLQNALKEKLDAEGERLLAVIRDNTQKMAQLIDDLLAFSRMGTTPLAARHIDMSRMARDVFEEVQTSANSERPVQLVLGELPPAYGDHALMRQVWINLLSNAIKYSGKRDQPVVEVSGQSGSHENVYSVKDNGAGFDMRYSDKLFGVFQRLHSAEDFPGTGVGLANVQRVVQRHGGRVWAEGKVNVGATFSFSLPKES
jgi:signal transduction histidine kinase/DNA-binding response OmpR family regulator